MLTLLFGQGAEAQPAGSSAPATEPRKRTAAASITATAQQARGVPPGTESGEEERERREQRDGRAAYRLDALAELPAPAPGGGRGSLVGHVRLGQGVEVATGLTYTGSFNSVAFEQAGGSAFAILAQLYYQIDLPLAKQDGERESRIVLTVGKIDPFVFFDQNEVSDDETSSFLTRAFVHNPLLDSGGDVGADRYGFTPGVRAAWFSGSRHRVGASFAILGSGRGAEFSSSPGRPFVIAQVEVAQRDIHGEVAGNYRVYGWTNPQATGPDGLPAKHVGWGVSIDQRLGKELTAFARVGRRTRGHGTFDRALTVGAELAGTAWRRPQDAVGLAVGRLSPGARRESRSVSGVSGVPGEPGGRSAEQVFEVFYRHALADSIEISPTFQAVRRAAGNPSTPTRHVLGMRIKLAF